MGVLLSIFLHNKFPYFTLTFLYYLLKQH